MRELINLAFALAVSLVLGNCLMALVIHYHI